MEDKKFMPDLEPWERQPGEGVKPFEAFVIYRDMGKERGLRKVSRQLEKSLTLIGRWSSNYNWVERVAAWENEQDRLHRIQQQKDIANMRKRHATLAEDMLTKAANALANLDPDEIKPQDISRMVEVASRLEKASRGDVTDVVEERKAAEPAAPPVVFYIPDNNRD